MEGPEYYAERVREYYGLSFPAAREELIDACWDRGAAVAFDHLHGGGYYLRLPESLICLDYGAAPFVIAHELYHHIMADLAEWDDDLSVALYVFTPHGRSRQERDANRFAELLCGPWEG
jgi:hypothetical protein